MAVCLRHLLLNLRWQLCLRQIWDVVFRRGSSCVCCSVLGWGGEVMPWNLYRMRIVWMCSPIFMTVPSMNSSLVSGEALDTSHKTIGFLLGMKTAAYRPANYRKNTLTRNVSTTSAKDELLKSLKKDSRAELNPYTSSRPWLKWCPLQNKHHINWFF